MKRAVLGLLLILVVGTAALWSQGGFPAVMTKFASSRDDGDAHANTKAQRGTNAAIPVVLTQVKRMSVPLSFSTIGTIQPTASIAITSQVSGTISAVDVADGAEVKQGDILVEIDGRLIATQIEQAHATVVRDQANIEKAQRDLDRVNKLLNSKFETQENAADAQTVLDLAKAALLSDQAALHNLQIQQEYYTIRAPLAGRIGTVQVKPGSTIVAGTQASPIVTLNAFDPIYVAVGIPQKMIAELSEDKAQGLAKVSLTIPGRDDKREGPVTVIDNAADATTGLITVFATIGNAPALLWPGEIVNVDVSFHNEADALVIPGEAVQSNPQGNYVYTVDGDSEAHVSPVVIARNANGMAVVASGLDEGDSVVVDGQLQLSEGVRVSTKQAQAGN
jgi:membrane fusion protein, multidrug efflux system